VLDAVEQSAVRAAKRAAEHTAEHAAELAANCFSFRPAEHAAFSIFDSRDR
jgi:hypothetical protein